MKNVESIETLRLNYPDERYQQLKEAVDDSITALEQTERIAELLNRMDVPDLTMEEFEKWFQRMSVREIKDTLWRFYCFASDACDIIIM